MHASVTTTTPLNPPNACKTCIYVAHDVSSQYGPQANKDVCKALEKHADSIMTIGPQTALPVRRGSGAVVNTCDDMRTCLDNFCDALVCCLDDPESMSQLYYAAGLAAGMGIPVFVYMPNKIGFWEPLTDTPYTSLDVLVKTIVKLKPRQRPHMLPEDAGYYEDTRQDHTWWHVTKTTDTPPQSPTHGNGNSPRKKRARTRV